MWRYVVCGPSRWAEPIGSKIDPAVTSWVLEQSMDSYCPSSVVIRALESPLFGIRSSFERTTNDSRIFWRFVLSNIRRTNIQISLRIFALFSIIWQFYPTMILKYLFYRVIESYSWFVLESRIFVVCWLRWCIRESSNSTSGKKIRGFVESIRTTNLRITT